MEHVFEVPVLSMLPFVMMLACIAVFPLVAEHWWEKNSRKMAVVLLLASPVIYWLLSEGQMHSITHSLEEYMSFIILLGTLFVISGNILITADLVATPVVNVVFLLVGSVLASLMGTTGASMLLIRPFLRTNYERKYKIHSLIVFIWLVSNIGGMLTPLGDPPLFLGYLRGVPFAFTFSLWKEWVLGIALAASGYFVLDTILYLRESKARRELDVRRYQPLRLAGEHNFLLIMGVVLAVAFLNELYIGAYAQYYLREIILIALAIISWWSTRAEIRKANHFSWAPIQEVAILFVGIFATMIPVQLYLETQGESLHFISIGQYFWATGGLSTLLDNAPTYLTFLTLAQGSAQSLIAAYPDFLVVGVPAVILKAISVAAVAGGLGTYIGNGPNLMVRAIAEHAGVKMPNFFAYMLVSYGFLMLLGWLIVSFVL